MTRQQQRNLSCLTVSVTCALLLAPALVHAQPPDSEGGSVGGFRFPSGASFDPSTTASPDILGRSSASQGGNDAPIRGPGSGGDGDGDEGPMGYDIVDLDIYDVEAGFGATIPEFHVVENGDTLWGISDTYFRDPYIWPKVWSFNETITNAHWIFPGDRVRLTDPSDSAVGGNTIQVPPPSLTFERTKRIDAIKSQEQLLDRYAFVDREDLDADMEVYGGAQAKVMMSLGDTMYVTYDASNPPVSGERLAVYAPTRPVHDVRVRGKKRNRVREGEVIGYLVEVVGEVYVKRVAKESAEVVVVDAMRPIERGFKVGELRSRFSRIRPAENETNDVGRIVGSFEEHDVIGELDLFMINLGSDRGVRRGNILEVVHKGDEYSPKHDFDVPYTEGHPRRVLAEVMVVQVQPEASLGIVLVGLKELTKGDPVEIRTPEMLNSEEPTMPATAGNASGSASGGVGDGSASGSASVELGSGR